MYIDMYMYFTITMCTLLIYKHVLAVFSFANQSLANGRRVNELLSYCRDKRFYYYLLYIYM